MLLKIVIGVVIVLVVFLVVVLMQPSDFRVVRSKKMKGSPAVAFSQVNDFRKWEGWSPWEKLDLKMKKVYEGPEAGKGATYSWNGDNNVGEGKLTILESKPDEQVDLKLEFKRPFTCTNDASFTFKKEGDETLVTWEMTGKNRFMAKMMGLFINMDKMVGSQFEDGLNAMGNIVESESK